MASLLFCLTSSLGTTRQTWRSWKRPFVASRCLVYSGEHVCWKTLNFPSTILMHILMQFTLYNKNEIYNVNKMVLLQLVQPNWFQWDMGSRSCRSCWLLLMTLYLWTPSLRNAWQLSHAMSTSKAVTLLHSTKFKVSSSCS